MPEIRAGGDGALGDREAFVRIPQGTSFRRVRGRVIGARMRYGADDWHTECTVLPECSAGSGRGGPATPYSTHGRRALTGASGADIDAEANARRDADSLIVALLITARG
jgi:hypothetical protein